MSPGNHVICNGMEYELICRCKCGHFHGWMAHPCDEYGMPSVQNEKWISNKDISGIIDKVTRQYVLC